MTKTRKQNKVNKIKTGRKKERKEEESDRERAIAKGGGHNKG